MNTEREKYTDALELAREHLAAAQSLLDTAQRAHDSQYADRWIATALNKMDYATVAIGEARRYLSASQPSK